jgi:hypothetical protein
MTTTLEPRSRTASSEIRLPGLLGGIGRTLVTGLAMYGRWFT